MPATKSELSNKEDFRGDILDRDFPVHFDAKTGTYSYDYADVSAALASELDKIKYYRVASPKLAEVEAEVVKHLKAEGPKPPPVKGEITKAAEALALAEKESRNVATPIFQKQTRGEALTTEETQALAKSKENFKVLIRPKKAQEAKQIYNSIWDDAPVNIKELEKKEKELKDYNDTPLNKRSATPPTPLTPEEITFKASPEYAKLKSATAIIDAYELLETLEEKLKSTTLTPEEQVKKTAAEALLNSTPRTNNGRIPVSLNERQKNIKEKQAYNNARALVTQIEGTPNTQRSAKQLKNLSNAKAIVRGYEASHPSARGEAFVKNMNILTAEGKAYASKVNAAQATITELVGKTSLSPEEEAKRTFAQKVLNAYATLGNPFVSEKEKSDAKAILRSAPSKNNTPSLQGVFEEVETPKGPSRNSYGSPSLTQGETPVRKLSNELIKAKAQKVITSIAALPTPLTPEQTALQSNAQVVVNAFTKLNNTTGTVKNANKATARNTIDKSTFLNQAKKLSIATGGKRRTRKTKKSKRKTQKRKQ